MKSKTLTVDGLEIFYREAGRADAPTLVLLHGFPSSSHQYRELIPRLAEHFHVIAPDYPGYGYSQVPPRETWRYSFDHLAQTMDSFLEQLGAREYVLYMHDFGGPVGLRIATAHPGRVKGLVVQNANAYDEGLSPVVRESQALWRQRTPETEAPVRGVFSPDGVRWQYTEGARDAATMTRDGYTFDTALVQRPGNDLIQLDLIADYGSNVALYPQWQAWLRRAQPKTLILWGQGDPLFLPAGAHAYRRDLPDAKLVLFDGGHFMLEEHAAQAAAEIVQFFGDGK